jgi:hypothetical protein
LKIPGVSSKKIPEVCSANLQASFFRSYVIKAQSFSPNLARDGRQVCRQLALIQYEQGDMFVAHLMPN